MDCLHKIPPSGTPAQHHKAHRNCHARLSSKHGQEDRERRDRSRSQSTYSRHHSSSHRDLHRGHSRSQQEMGTAAIEAAQDYPIQYTEASCRTCHDAPHQPYCRSSTHCSSSSYCCQDCNRSFSHPSYRLSKYTSHQRVSCSLRSCSNQET